MKDRIVPVLAGLFFLAMLIAVTYPGYVPFNTIRPFVLGLPFTLFWQVLWVSAAVLVLAGVFVWEKRRHARSDDARAGGPGIAGVTGPVGDEPEGPRAAGGPAGGER